MALQPRLTLRTEQRLVMTVMLQQAISLLPMTRLELQQAVHQELLENPVLEEALEEVKEVVDGEMPEAPDEVPSTETDERGEVEIDWENIVQDDYGLRAQAGPPPGEEDFPSYEQTLSQPETLREHLEWQLQLSAAPGPVRRVAGQIVGNLDEAGYLQADPQELAALEGFGPQEAGRALSLVQEFDPPGVGARDLRECLLLQLRSLERDGLAEPGAIDLALRLAHSHLEMLEERHQPRLARQLGVEAEEIQAAVRLIQALHKLPGVGAKTAQRLTYYLVRLPEEEARALAQAIIAVKERIILCSQCQNLTETDPCPICTDPARDQTAICVLEEPLDVLALERTRCYKGLYHVLHGVISPINGIGVE
ncbi:MAG: recombination protein RecR, partial [Candidatus Tectomicrobia bacterium]|nr:recombination protein RecR [Candidatus Tectomicrobia bacterium]